MENTPYKRKKILIVDDEPLILFGLSKTFQEMAEITTVANGENACEKINSSFYDLCFLDVYLPGMSGLEVAKKIKEKSPQTEVVIMTAYADDATKEEIRSKSCLFLEKPFNLAEVKRVVQEKLA